MGSENEKEIVPLHDSTIEVTKVRIYNPVRIFLSGDRRVETWKVKDSDGLGIKIYRPTEDGKISELKFGLSHDAAMALATCLIRQLEVKK